MNKYTKLLSIGLLLSCAGLNAMQAPGSKSFIAATQAVPVKNTLEDFGKIFRALAVNHKKTLKEFLSVLDEANKLEQPSLLSNNSLTVKSHFFRYKLSELSYKLRLFDEIVNEISLKDSIAMAALRFWSKKDSIQRSLLDYIEQHKNTSQLLQAQNIDSDNLLKQVNILKEKLKVFLKETKDKNGCSSIKMRELLSLYNLEQKKIDFLTHSEIDEEGLRAQLKSEPFAPKGIRVVSDAVNKSTIHLYQLNEQNETTPWFKNYTLTIDKWFTSPEENLKKRAQSNPKNKNYSSSQKEVEFHSFPKEVDGIAKEYGLFDESSSDQITVLMPGCIIKDNAVTYGNFEFIFHRKTRTCFHRFFKPIKFKTKSIQNSAIIREAKVHENALSEDERNIRKIVAGYHVIRDAKYKYSKLSKKLKRYSQPLSSFRYERILEEMAQYSKEEHRQARKELSLTVSKASKWMSLSEDSKTDYTKAKNAKIKQAEFRYNRKKLDKELKKYSAKKKDLLQDETTL